MEGFVWRQYRQQGLNRIVAPSCQNLKLQRSIFDLCQRPGELQVVRHLLFDRLAKMFSCNAWLCPGSHEVNHKRSGQRSPYERLFNSIISSQPSEVDMAVSILETKALVDNAFCARCLERFNACLRGAREEIWASLPRMFGLNPWSSPRYGGFVRI